MAQGPSAAGDGGDGGDGGEGGRGGDGRRDARRRMVEEQIRPRGVEDERVLAALVDVPRALFMAPEQRHLAYEDRAVPLASGQTVSQPYIVAAMTAALELEPGDRVLEIGTGSGYQTAVLSRLAERVYSVERLEELADVARETLRKARADNVELRVGDGTLGWAEQAPFDAIVVTAAAPEVPPSLKEQLDAGGGRLVIPVGTRGIQDLIRVVRRGQEYASEALMGCRFVPLVGEEGWPP